MLVLVQILFNLGEYPHKLRLSLNRRLLLVLVCPFII